MSFLEWMVSHMEYCGIGSVFGLGRTILWLIVQILVWLGELVANLYKNAFKVINVLWSDEVRSYIEDFLPYLWIPVTVSVVILGYNLIAGDDGGGAVRLKTFGRNLCLFILIMALVPVLFIGYTDSSGTTQDGQIKSLFLQGDDNNPTTMADGLSTTGDVTTEIYKTVAENVYDLQSIFNQAEDVGGINEKWSDQVGGAISENDYMKAYDNSSSGSNGEYALKNIMNIGPAETIKYENVTDDYFDGDFSVYDAFVGGYDHVYYANKTYLVDWSPFASVTSESEIILGYSGLTTTQKARLSTYRQEDSGGDDATLNTQDMDTGGSGWESATQNAKASEYLFQIVHDNYYRISSSDGTTEAVLINNSGETKSSIWFIDSSTYPFRYSIEWGLMILTLIIEIIVMYLTSFKIVKLIYELTINQLLVIIFGAFDLSSGQKAKEIFKASFSIVASIAFAVINVEFFFVVKSAIKDITFSNTNNGWIQAIMTLFVGMATIKGPSILERVLGYSGGLSDEWRQTGALNRAAVKPAARAAGKAAKGAALLGGGAALYGMSKLKGRHEAKKAQKSGGSAAGAAGSGSGGGAGGSPGGKGKAQSGNASQFKMAANKKNDKTEAKAAAGTGTKPQQNKKDAAGKQAANADVARQGRGIAASMQKAQKDTQSANEQLGIVNDSKANHDKVAQNHANEYKGTIQNAALAEQMGSSGSDSPLNDRQALEKAYEGSGFTAEEAKSLANRDIADGSFTQKKEDFQNSISDSAKQKMADSPLSYASQSDAYQEAAQEHLQAMGYSEQEAKNIDRSQGLSQGIMLDDNQQAIRDEANALVSSGAVATDEEAVKQAIRNQTGGSRGGNARPNNLNGSSGRPSSSGGSTQSANRQSGSNSTPNSSSTSQSSKPTQFSANQTDLGSTNTRGSQSSATYTGGGSSTSNLGYSGSQDFSGSSPIDNGGYESGISYDDGGSYDGDSYSSSSYDDGGSIHSHGSGSAYDSGKGSRNSGGYDGRYGDIDKATSRILSQGSLEEGVVRGRVAHNEARAQAMTNTHGSALAGGGSGSRRPEMDIPGSVEMAAGVTMGYMGYRTAKGIADSGYRSGMKKQQKKAARKERKKPENSHKINNGW